MITSVESVGVRKPKAVTATRRPRVLVLGVAVAIAVGGASMLTTDIAVATTSDDSGAGPTSVVSKSGRPANINPSKSPILDRSKLRPDPTMPLSPQQQRAAAIKWESQDPLNRITCWNPDGSVAGMAILDRVDPTKAMTVFQKVQLCGQATPGSHP